MRSAVLLSLLLLSPLLASSLSLPHFFGSHMVLQHSKKINLFGQDTAGSQVTVTFLSNKYPTTTNTEGNWSVVLPATAPTAIPITIDVVSSAGGSISLTDVVIGDVYICSGQSNMDFNVLSAENHTDVNNDSTQYGPKLRILQVTRNGNYNPFITTPQRDFAVDFPWSQVGASSPLQYFSAYCYFFGLNIVKSLPGAPPVGLITSSWGGTAIEPWMGPDALTACGEATTGNSTATFPTNPSCLWYSMIYPLLPVPINGFLWYQGESNAGNPVNYSRCFPAMINGWRQAWFNNTSGQTDPDLPFIFAQLSSWANGDNGVIAVQRYAQMAALKLAKVGMSVAADIGDAAAPSHPIHPIYKAELGRRSWLAAWNIIYGNTSSPVQGPQLLKTQVDLWDASWGDYHYGMGSSNICQTASTGFTCLGIRLTFDQALYYKPNSQAYVNGFDIITTTNLLQPVSFSGLRDSDTTIQLNVTVTSGNLHTIYYAWHDYPIMPFYGTKFNLPIQPFNLTIS